MPQRLKKLIRCLSYSPKLRHQNSGGTNNLPPILFHTVHGENIRLSPDGTTAKRSESFCKGVIFSNRPIRINERICIRFAEISSNWSGAIRFGYTTNDPNTYRSGLPKYVCPDMTNKSGNWAKALAERHAQPDSILFYYVSEDGDVRYGINGEERGVFFSGVNTSLPIWALIDVYGNTVAIESLDPRQQLNNRRRSEDFDRIVPTFSSLDINRENREPLPQVYRDANFQSLPFHRTKGCNIRLSNDRCVAERNNSHYCQGYVFSQRHLRLGEKLVIQILQTDDLYAGSLAFGLTSCDPTNINGNDLPEDPHQLLDRPEYWVVIKDVANSPRAGDELAVKITETGEVQLIKNKHLPITLMHVDYTQRLYPFFDLYGSTIKVKVLGTTGEVNENARNSAQLLNSRNLHDFRASHAPLTATNNNSPNNNSLTVRLPSNEFKSNSYSTISSLNSDGSGSLNENRNECTVCYEQPINSVLYMCGHVCMCYECAVKQWRGPGQCPLCRAVIRDVIRTYWS